MKGLVLKLKCSSRDRKNRLCGLQMLTSDVRSVLYTFLDAWPDFISLRYNFIVNTSNAFKNNVNMVPDRSNLYAVL